jgi:hypothetical protein
MPEITFQTGGKKRFEGSEHYLSLTNAVNRIGCCARLIELQQKRSGTLD